MKAGIIIGTYPSDTGWEHHLQINEPVAIAWLKDKFGEIYADDYEERNKELPYLNKGYTVLYSDHIYGYALCKHDYNWYIKKKRFDKMTPAEKLQAIKGKE